MAKIVDVIEQKYFSEFQNGIGFVSNLTDYTTNLAGSIGERLKMQSKISVSWKIEYIATDADPTKFDWDWTFAGDIITWIRGDGGDFTTEGFGVGQSVRLRLFDNIANVFVKTVSIVSIGKTTMVMDLDGTTVLPFGPGGIQIIGLEPLTALIHDFGYIGNDENFTTESKVTEGLQSFYGADIGLDSGFGRSTSWVNLEKRGLYNDFVTGSMKARWVEDIDSTDAYYQIFEIEHIFVLNPLSVEGENQNLIDGIAPDYLIGDESLKYVFNSDFRQVLNNPNVSYPAIEENTLGSVAWFGESFNGFNNDYVVDSIEYKDQTTGATADGILIEGTTEIKVVVSKKAGSFVAGDKYGAYLFLLATKEDYTNTEDSTMLDNFVYDRAVGVEGATVYAGDDYLKTMNATLVSGSLEITITTQFNTSQKTKLTTLKQAGNDTFVVSVQVGDQSLSAGNSNRVTLIAGTPSFDESADIDGLVSVENFKIFPHYEPVDTGTGFTDYVGWNEDGILSAFDIVLTASMQAVLNSVSLKLVAYDPLTNESFDLDSVDLQLNSVMNGTLQQINVVSSRGYNLENGSQFNLLEFTNKSHIPNVSTTFSVLFGQKIKWQSWIENLDVDSVFYDETKPNNNRNYKSSNYSDLEGYEIRLGALLNVSGVSNLGVSGSTDYMILSPKISVLDYDDGPVVPINWSGAINTIKPSNDLNLNLAISTTEDTLFKTVWTSLAPVGSTDGIWAIHRIEEANQSGDSIDEFSSVLGSASSNRLKALTGETKLKVSLVSGQIVTECLIDYTKLDPSKKYNLSARIGTGAPIVQANYKLTSPLGQQKSTSGTVDDKILSE